MKYVLCPPCGTVFANDSEDQLVREAQEHASQKHGYMLSPEEVAEWISATPPFEPGGTG